jgi:hypothetical protein
VTILSACATENKKQRSLELSAMPNHIQAVIKPSELIAWLDIKDRKDPNEYKKYIQIYPDGKFSTIAKIKIDGGEAQEKDRYPFDGIWTQVFQSLKCIAT